MSSKTDRREAGSSRSSLVPIDPEAVRQAQTAIPPKELLTVVVEAFDVLADPTRARILYALGRHTLCVRDLAIVIGVSESAMSHQLRLLRDRRVVRARRQGTTMYYSVDDQHVAALVLATLLIRSTLDTDVMTLPRDRHDATHLSMRGSGPVWSPRVLFTFIVTLGR